MLLLPPALIQSSAPDAELRDLAARLFAAMRARDEAGLRRCFLAEGRLLSTQVREGKPAQRLLSVEAFIRMCLETKEPYDERMPDPEVRVDGDAATIVGAYTFRVGERLTNCGSNAFHCVRTVEGWRIAEILSTIRTSGCQP